MKDQLTFEQWLEKYIPNHRDYPCNGYNDPYQEWWYYWMGSGHAEEARLKREAESKEWDRKQKEKREAEDKFREDAINKANIPDDVSVSIRSIWGESVWEELLNILVEKQKEDIKKKENKERLSAYIKERYK